MAQESRRTQNLTGEQIGRYLVQEQIGRGGVATVYRALDQVDHRVVALKVLSPSADETTVQRFRNEALTAGRLRHPNIVPIYQVGTAADSQVPYIAMALVEGESLTDLLTKTGRLPSPAACALLEPIARALDFAHREGIVHRDVKPSNILLQPVDESGSVDLQLSALEPSLQPLLSDFGVARAFNAPELTAIGQTVGTPAYMAPEQASGNTEIDGRADIYALGAVLYRTVVGHLPYSGSASQILHDHVYAPLTIDDQALRRLPETVVDIISYAMAKQPQDRYQTAAAMADALALASDRQIISSSSPQSSSLDAATATMAALPSTAEAPPQQHVLVRGRVIQPAAEVTNRPTSSNRRWLTILATIALVALLAGGVMALPSLMDRMDENGINQDVAPFVSGPVTAAPSPNALTQSTDNGDSSSNEGDGVALVLVTATHTPASSAVTLDTDLPALTEQNGSPTSVIVTPTPFTQSPPTPRPLAEIPQQPQPQPTTAEPLPEEPVIDAPVAIEPNTLEPGTPEQQVIFTCANVIEPSLAGYIEGLDPLVVDGFRCPNSGASYTTGKLLRFEHGFMLDLANDPSVYIYYELNQEWERAVSGWREGDSPRPIDIVPPAPNLYQPSRAYGDLWSQTQRQVALGFATVEEPTTFTAIEQTFPNGALVRNMDDGTVWLFLREKLRL